MEKNRGSPDRHLRQRRRIRMVLDRGHRQVRKRREIWIRRDGDIAGIWTSHRQPRKDVTTGVIQPGNTKARGIHARWSSPNIALEVGRERKIVEWIDLGQSLSGTNRGASGGRNDLDGQVTMEGILSSSAGWNRGVVGRRRHISATIRTAR
jgi:hypothetical protein